MGKLSLWLLLIAPVLAAGQSVEPARGSLVICEIYPDPDSRSLIPPSEFVELKNVSPRVINLKGWRLSDGSSTAVINTNLDLKPDSFLIVCGTNAANNFKNYGAVLAVTNFPSLNNDADNLTLYSAVGTVIHHVAYSTEWYRNAVKSDGGWTLEMIDTHNACGGRLNWRASEAPAGGTPGSKNSVDEPNPDEQPPALVSTYTPDSLHIVAVFDEPVDSAKAYMPEHYKLSGGTQRIIVATPLLPAFNKVELELDKPLITGVVYNLSITGVPDCSGNEPGVMHTAKAGLPALCRSGDVIINELLFNPVGSGYDYLELYNRSDQVIDLGKLIVASKNSVGALANTIAVSSGVRLFFPGDYLALTESIPWLQQHYHVKGDQTVIQVGDLPSMPDDKGYIALTDNSGNLIDELNYSDKWHFALINNKEGVALERINYNHPGDDKSNWTSASSVAGFGTPGYVNSQLHGDQGAQGSFVIEPKIFSPDNDGYHDVATFRYEMVEAGYMGNLIIFDVTGRPVRWLLKSGLLGLKGAFTWDGVDENQKRLPVGVYVVMMEVFNLKGTVKKIKNTITLARRF